MKYSVKFLAILFFSHVNFSAFAQLPPYPLPFDYMPANFPFLITEADATAYTQLEYKRIENRLFGNSHIFYAQYSDQAFVEVTVLQDEYSLSDAAYYAELFGKMLGRLPVGLRERVERIELIKSEPGRGIMFVVPGTQTISIQINASENQIDECFQLFCPIEETLLHETGHIVQERIESLIEWNEARVQDNEHISVYAERNASEDIAESVVAWVGMQTPERLYPTPAYRDSTQEFVESIRSTIGHRLEVLDDLFLPIWNRNYSEDEYQSTIIDLETQIMQGNELISGLRNEITSLSSQADDKDHRINDLQSTIIDLESRPVPFFDFKLSQLQIPKVLVGDEFYEIVLKMTDAENLMLQVITAEKLDTQ